jgi:uncharacterized protein YbjT (DUF2867 family)
VKIVCVLGGTGFVGHAIVRQLSESGYLVKVLARNIKNGKHLAQLKNVQVIECSLNTSDLKRSLKSAHAVINLVGILHQSKKNSFDSIHADLPHRLAQICAEFNIPRLIHMSALKASVNAPSEYLRSKGKGEDAVLKFQNKVNITLFRPSVIFGPCDNFINLFAKLIKVFPIIPLAKPLAKFQPIFVEDVSQAVNYALENKTTFGKTYELTGPSIYTLLEIIRLITNTLKKRRLIIGLSDQLSYLQAWGLEQLPLKLMTRDNLRSMQVDNISNVHRPDYFNFEPKTLESILPSYIN